MFRSLIHFELNFVYDTKQGSCYAFACDHSVVPASFFERLFFSPLNGHDTLDKNPLSVDDHFIIPVAITHVCTLDSKEKKRRKRHINSLSRRLPEVLPNQLTSPWTELGPWLYISAEETGGMWSLLQLLELTANGNFSFIYYIY